MRPRIVLDTNMFRSLSERQLEALAARFVISISETAITETWARSVKEYRDGKSRAEARGHLFGRARRLRRFIDADYPLALVGGDALERIVQQISGRLDEDSESGRAAVWLRHHWGVLSGIGYTDEGWLAAGTQHGEWLGHLDGELAAVARRDDELWADDKLWAGLPDDEREASRRMWDALAEPEQLEQLRIYARETLCPSPLGPAVADRLDGMVHLFALRLHLAAHGRQMPKENDGADLRLAVHLGEGAMLLTGDKALIKSIDASGTIQAPWVRGLPDLDEPVADGPPWGESARQAAASFRRRSV